MVLDTDGVNCVTASFVFGLDAVERVYDIRVLQYETNNEMGGPPGCLQFLLGTVAAPHSGTVTSFNFAGGKNQKSSLWTILKLSKRILPKGTKVNLFRFQVKIKNYID